MVEIVATVIIALFLGFLIYAATRPNTFRIQRSLNIQMPADKIFPLINDLPSWRSWSPYEGRDPAMKRTYTGSQSGKGAIYEWDGNKNVGTGRMEILDAVPPTKIVIKLDFLKPFEGHNTAEFMLVPQGSVTNVTWAMSGPKTYFCKIMHCFIDMDKMIGTDFQNGLTNLKTVVEKQQAASYG